MNKHPFSLKGGATCFLMVFHAILRLILKNRFCAGSLRELSVLFFKRFTTMFSIYFNFKHQNNHLNFPFLRNLLLCVVGEHNKRFFYPICHFRFTPASSTAPILFTSILAKSFFALENIVNVYF